MCHVAVVTPEALPSGRASLGESERSRLDGGNPSVRGLTLGVSTQTRHPVNDSCDGLMETALSSGLAFQASHHDLAVHVGGALAAGGFDGVDPGDGHRLRAHGEVFR